MIAALNKYDTMDQTDQINAFEDRQSVYTDGIWPLDKLTSSLFMPYGAGDINSMYSTIPFWIHFA